jgi:hypothetical protein
MYKVWDGKRWRMRESLFFDEFIHLFRTFVKETGEGVEELRRIRKALEQPKGHMALHFGEPTETVVVPEVPKED